MKYKYTISGIDCPNCASKLAKLFEKADGVDSAKINFLSEKLTVESELSEAELLPMLREVAEGFDSDIEIE
nr:cation transporter [Clostridia bacterium]